MAILHNYSVARTQHSDPLVSVVILSYNRPHFLRESVESISNQTYRNLEVLVMDNGSTNVEAIHEAVSVLPQAKLYLAKTNVGYTGGMNAGVAIASGEYVYITEDDMCTEADCIERLVRYAESDALAAIVSGSVYSREENRLVCCGGQVRLNPVFSWLLYNQTSRDDCAVSGPYCATYTTGAMMLFRRKRFLELGGFHSQFFMYCEDTEFCLRCRENGYSVVIVPDAIATNWQTGNAPESSKIPYHRFKNFIATYLLHARAKVIPEFVLRYVVFGLLRQLSNPTNAHALLKALLWNLGNLPVLIKERRHPLVWNFSDKARANWSIYE